MTVKALPSETRWVTWLGRALVELYRSSMVLFTAAPLIVAIAAIPEFLQHVVEINIGMFDSRAAAHALAADPRRMALGYFKIAGLVLAMFASARWWWAREHGGRWFAVRDMLPGRLLMGLVGFVGLPFIAEPLRPSLAPFAFGLLSGGLSILSFPFLWWLLAGLFGDWVAPLAGAWRTSWGSVAGAVVLIVAAYGPAMAIHYLDHFLAFGRPALVVWPLMLFDALVVGMLATLAGAAFMLAYERFRALAVRTDAAR